MWNSITWRELILILSCPQTHFFKLSCCFYQFYQFHFYSNSKSAHFINFPYYFYHSQSFCVLYTNLTLRFYAYCRIPFWRYADCFSAFFFVFYETKHIKPQYFFNFSDSIKKDGWHQPSFFFLCLDILFQTLSIHNLLIYAISFCAVFGFSSSLTTTISGLCCFIHFTISP